MQKKYDVGLVWLRRDLRLHDNAALQAALAQCQRLHCLFVLDRAILDHLPPNDRRVAFIHQSLHALDADLRAQGGAATGLLVAHGNATELVAACAHLAGAKAVFYANDYEPQAVQRDAAVRAQLALHGIVMHAVTDHVVLAPGAVLTRAGTPFTVFTPYHRAWLQALAALPEAAPALDLHGRLLPRPAPYAAGIPPLEALGFGATTVPANVEGGTAAAQRLWADFLPRLDHYHEQRDYPARKGPSYLGVHLRFGTVSVRALAAAAQQRVAQGSAGAAVWLSELAWRDFYFQILAYFPHASTGAFKPAYDAIVWEQGPQAQAHFAAWCAGQTGYPLVDAAMQQLNQTGYMHNRLRMVAGSFLVKHLGLDWRWGERYFAAQLNDFDLAANNGGWQWVASSGCDAQPYFRIFNPVTQSQKFDADGAFIRRYLPQLAHLNAKHIHAPWLVSAQELGRCGIVLGQNYPLPIVEHAQARAKTLQRYAVLRPTAHPAD